MGRANWQDLRDRLSKQRCAGQSRRSASRQFGASARWAVKLARRVGLTGSIAPAGQGRCVAQGTWGLVPLYTALQRRSQPHCKRSWTNAAGRRTNGVFQAQGSAQTDIPSRYRPHTTCVNRFNRWRKAGHWARILNEVLKAYAGDIQMIDASSIRVHQHAANAKKKMTDPVAWVARAAA